MLDWMKNVFNGKSAQAPVLYPFSGWLAGTGPDVGMRGDLLRPPTPYHR